MKPIVRDLKTLYGKHADVQLRRYKAAELGFAESFGTLNSPRFFSAPGCTEICGSQTEHNNGKVFSASVDADTIAVAQPSDDGMIVIKSDDGAFPEFSANINELDISEEEKGTSTAFLKGLVKGFKNNGLEAGGFCAYISSAVSDNAELSRDASFEILMGTIICHLFNGGQIPQIKLAQIVHRAVKDCCGGSKYITKHIACASGGFSMIDYRDGDTPVIETIRSGIKQYDHALCIVDANDRAVDFSEERRAIETEMKAVAGYFDCDNLRAIALPDITLNLNELRRAFGDRAVLRCIHFFHENQRVERMIHALKNESFDDFLHAVKESGDSAFKYLQNVCPTSDVRKQSLSVALNTAESTLHRRGACRPHSDGFSGAIQAFVPLEDIQQFRMSLEKVFGTGSCYVLTVRDVGGTEVLLDNA